MTAYTTVLGLYKPGGGSTGQIVPDEPVDIDKLNGNFDLIDAAVGLVGWTTGTRPATPFLNQLGYNSTLDIYEKWSGSTWVPALPKYLQAAGLTASYFTKTQLTGGSLDSRYFTQTQLLTGGKLDSVYYSKTAIKFDWNVGSVNPSLDSGTGQYSGTQNVTFVTKFTSAPVVTATALSTDPGGVTASLSNITATGFTATISRRNNINTGFHWHAIGS